MKKMKKNPLIQKIISPDIQQLTAYHVPESGNAIKLDSMENPYHWDNGFVEEWLKILKSATVNRYPDAAAHNLKKQLRKVMNVPETMDIILGNGSDELIQMLILSVNHANQVLLVPEPSFIMYRQLAQIAGLTYVGVPLQANDFSLDMPAMRQAIKQYQPALIFLACPNNPTGNAFATHDIESIIETSRGIVVIDEAYAPFIDSTFMSRLGEYPNVLVMRTVSKLGLAGVRLGLLAGPPDWIEQINKVRQPYNINTLTQITVTLACQHYALFEAQTHSIKNERTKLFEELNAIEGVHAWISHANFILFRMSAAQDVFKRLKKQGILIKCVHGRHPLLHNCLQVTVGTPSDNQAFLQALKPSTKLIAERLSIPAQTQAILWDMDGVLIDSLSLDLVVCNQILAQHFGSDVTISKSLIRSLFAYDAVIFWELILAFVEKTYHLKNVNTHLSDILNSFHEARHTCVFELNPGILDILQAAKSLKMAVVSNNPTADVTDILTRCGIVDYFDVIVGNDIERVAKKPAPDTYLLAMRLLNVAPEKTVVIEDSLVGLEASNQAHCYSIAVATGSADFQELEPQSQHVYTAFERNVLSLQFGDVRQKTIITPNEFISHAIEHIAWRLGVEIDCHWYHNHWWGLGQTLGQKIRAFQIQQHSAVALGMIDDGSAEVFMNITDSPTLRLEGIANLDLDWFLSLRCEQLSSGTPLVELLEGLSQGLSAKIVIKICSVEDPHHTWEGVFRSLGIALNKIFTPKHPIALPFDFKISENVSLGEISVLANSLHYSHVYRGTAESHVSVAVDFSKQRPNSFVFNVAPSIDVSGFHSLLEMLADAAGMTIQVEFKATVLSSSHVVLEDTALVLGRALKEILTLRMEQWGVNGAGSSLTTIQDLTTQAIRVGISVEGRKFWKFVPFNMSMDQLKQDFLIGHDIGNHLRSEDLDDFLDGLSGGLSCSIIIHIDRLVEQGWQLLFVNLGISLKEVFALNPYRKGVPPGVKATLS